MWLFCLQGRKKGEKKFLPSSTFSCTTTTTCDDAWGGIRHLAKKQRKMQYELNAVHVFDEMYIPSWYMKA